MSNSVIDILRKIQITGDSTYIVSLPKDWINDNRLMKGSFIRISKTEKYLLLQPAAAEPESSIKKISLSTQMEESSESIVRKVISAYLNGYTLIHLSAQIRLRRRHKIALKEIARNKLIGTEILSDSPTELVMQVLLNYSKLSVRDALQRMSYIALSMHKDSISSLSLEDTRLAHEVILMDDEVDRFYLYIIRLLNMAVLENSILKDSGMVSLKECLGYRVIAKSIERMADHAANIAQNRLELKCFPLNPETIISLQKLSNNAAEVFEAGLCALLAQNFGKAEEVLSKRHFFKEEEDEVIRRVMKYARSDDAPLIRLLVENIIRTADYGADIAEIILNLTIDKNFD